MKNNSKSTQGYLIHNHITPIIPRHASKSDITTNDLQSDKSPQSSWARDFPLIWETNASKNKGKAISIRIIIYPLSSSDFPQYHRIIMTSPHFDLFNHWTFNCNPFTFRSFIKEMKWPIYDDEAECARLFENFGSMIKDRILECVSMPSRYLAKLRLNTHENLATLSFYEVINNYRCVELAHITFSPTPWDQVILEVRYDMRRMMDYHAKLKVALVKVLEIVSKHQPTLLLNGNGAGNVKARQITQSEKWKELVETLLPSKGSLYQQGVKTEEECIKRKEMFLIATENEDTSEFVCTKSINIKVQKGQEENTKRLLFTIYSKGPKKSPTYYFITVTDPNDLFLYFKSVEITHSKFLDITSRLDINVPGLEQDSKPEFMISEHPKRARDAALGYHPSEGAGGVVGVIAGDCLNGIDSEPERYLGTFQIFEDDAMVDSSYNSETNLKSKADQRGWKSSPTYKNDKIVRDWNEVMSSKLDQPAPIKNKEILRQASLKIKERVLYNTSHLISIPFEELSREELMGKVNDQYLNLQIEIQAAQTRLDSVLESVKRKNVALRTLLEGVDIPQPDSDQTPGIKSNNAISKGFIDDTDKLEDVGNEDDYVVVAPMEQLSLRKMDVLTKKPTHSKKERGKVKKLPVYSHPSSQSSKKSKSSPIAHHLKNKTSGLYPELFQPDLVSL